MYILVHTQNKKVVLMDMTPSRYDAIMENFGSDRNTVDDIDVICVIFSQMFGLEKEMVCAPAPAPGSSYQLSRQGSEPIRVFCVLVGKDAQVRP